MYLEKEMFIDYLKKNESVFKRQLYSSLPWDTEFGECHLQKSVSINGLSHFMIR